MPTASRPVALVGCEKRSAVTACVVTCHYNRFLDAFHMRKEKNNRG